MASCQQTVDLTPAVSTHCSQPLGERQAIVACEGKHLARTRSQSTNGDHDQQDEYDTDKACRTPNAVRGVLEDINERVACLVRERFSNVADAESISKAN
jgi:hypothetical protein